MCIRDRIDIVKPLGWERTSTTLTDMDMNYLLLYLEENYGLTSEKKVQSAIKIVANENRYHPVRDYLNSPVSYTHLAACAAPLFSPFLKKFLK